MTDWGFWILVSVGIVVGILLLIALAGCFIPRSHRVGRALALQQPRETVWQVITDHDGTPQWNKNITKTERQPDRNGHEYWKETFDNKYGMFLETIDAVPPTRLVRAIIDEQGPFTGRWEFMLDATETGCRIRITEFGDIGNPFFRVMFRIFMKPELYIDMYLTALAGKFQEPPAITAAQ